MSSKKDNFNKKNSKYIKIAINLAKQNVGLTGMNPSVGSIIVNNDEIISYGATRIGGRPHAEYTAIKNCKSNLINSKIYISLEPCSHFGKTPPCTNSIIKAGISKVYYAVDDVDKRTSKKAKYLLNKKKIKVTKNLLINDAKKIYTPYFYSKKNEVPYIIGKIACSKDNLISSKKKYITNYHSINVSHLLRYKSNGLLITYKTVNSDNPMLTCRIRGLEKFSPKRFIIDKNGRIKINSYVVKSAKIYKTYILYNNITKRKKKYLLKKGVKLIHMNLDNNNNFDFKLMFKKIYKLNVSTLLVEGGKILTSTLVKLNLFNEFYLFKSNNVLGKKGKINISDIINDMSKNFDYKKKIDTYLDKDKLINYYWFYV